MRGHRPDSDGAGPEGARRGSRGCASPDGPVRDAGRFGRGVEISGGTRADSPRAVSRFADCGPDGALPVCNDSGFLGDVRDG